MEHAFERHNLTPPTYEQTRKTIGLSLGAVIDKLAPRALSHEDLKAIGQSYKNAFCDLRQNQDNQEPVYDGAQDMLTRMSRQGWTLGVATGKSRRGLDAVIKREGWRDLFTATYCADDGAGKPDPFMVRANLNAAKKPASRAVIIGDTSFDMLMGKAAGIAAFGVDWGFHTREEIHSGGADAIFSSMKELGQALDKFALKVRSHG